MLFVTSLYMFLPLCQATVKTIVQQEEQLKKMETISALRETNKMLKMDRDKLEQELQQAQAKVSLHCTACHRLSSCLSWPVPSSFFLTVTFLSKSYN